MGVVVMPDASLGAAVVRRLRVLRRIGDEIRLAPRAAEQDLFTVVHVAVGRIGFRRHAADGIALCQSIALGGMVMGRMYDH